MKYFIFTNPCSADIFDCLMGQYREQVKELSRHAWQSATEALTDEKRKLSDDDLCDDDEMVINRLSLSLCTFVTAQIESLTGEFPEPGTLLGNVLSSGLEQVDFRSIAKAVFYNVEPGSDPEKEKPLPEIL